MAIYLQLGRLLVGFCCWLLFQVYGNVAMRPSWATSTSQYPKLIRYALKEKGVVPAICVEKGVKGLQCE